MQSFTIERKGFQLCGAHLAFFLCVLCHISLQRLITYLVQRGLERYKTSIL